MEEPQQSLEGSGIFWNLKGRVRVGWAHSGRWDMWAEVTWGEGST